MGKRRSRQPRFDVYHPLLDDEASEELDLHGMTAFEARKYLERRFKLMTKADEGRLIHIITGKGTHSKNGSILTPLVRGMLGGSLSSYVREQQEDVAGGGFRVRLR